LHHRGGSLQGGRKLIASTNGAASRFCVQARVAKALRPGCRLRSPPRKTRPARPAGGRRKSVRRLLTVKNPFSICYLQMRCADWQLCHAQARAWHATRSCAAGPLPPRAREPCRAKPQTGQTRNNHVAIAERRDPPAAGLF
jgi:hypothetical protein